LLGYHEAIETPFRDAYRLLDNKQQLTKQQLLIMLARSEHDSLAIEEAVLSLMAILLGQGYQQPPVDNDKMTIEQREMVFDVQCFLNQSFRENISLNDTAHQVFYSEYALCRLFKQQVGTSIYQYLTSLRLSQALQDLVEYPQKAIGDIGMELGFSSPSHFSTRFLNTFGMTPSDFREQATNAKLHKMHKNLKVKSIAS
jgi:AraC family transcriptional regulator